MALELQPGDTFGDFKVHRVLRRFPHAWVYEVDVPGMPERQALKVSLDPVSSEETARRALREVAVLGTLTNRHVIKVHDSGMGPGDHWYILTEALEGAPLHQWHDFDTPLPPADAAGFVHQACLGLAEVHQADIVHRDLSPERLWVEPDRTVKILDFSSARSWGAGATGDNVTVGTVLTGSPQYSAPEQMTAAALTPAADVYSLGLILYEMLSGHTAFFPNKSWSAARRELADDPAAWLRAHAKTTPTPLTEHPACADLPRKLVDLVHRTLEKDPAARPETAGALANELGWILHHDLGAAQAAIVRSRGPNHASGYHLVLPGSHRVGFGPGIEVSLGPDGPAAVATIEWAGPPRLAELVVTEADVLVNGTKVQGRVDLAPGDEVRIGDHVLYLSYPPPKG